MTRTFVSAERSFTALSDITLGFGPGEYAAIVGRSGSGKSTLLNMMTGIDLPSAGSVRVAGTELSQLDESALAAFRGKNIGIVFQFFQLLPTLTIRENVLLAMELVGAIPPATREARTRQLLEQVGIAAHSGKLPGALSGGEQQRAAIARALANDPPLLVADEPTGNLDSRTAEAINGLFRGLASSGKTVVVVTHEAGAARQRQGGAARRWPARRRPVMRLRLTKAVRELKIHPQRTLLVLLALGLGVWGVGAIAVSNVILRRDLAENFQRTSPAHAVLSLGEPLGVDLRELEARPEIESVELRDFSIHRVEVQPDVWIPLWLYGVDDFERLRVARIFPQSGAAIPERGSILVERDGLRVSWLRPGKPARARIGGRVVDVPVSGVTFDPGQAPATQDAFIYAYTDRASWSALTGQPSQQRLIVRFRGVHSKEEVRRASALLVEDLRAKGIGVRSLEVPPFEAHPHQWQLDTLLLTIGSIGALAFVLAAVLVSQLMRSLLARQVREIGILKAIGASRGQVLEIYLAMLLLLGGAAGVISIPLAVLTGQAFSAFVARTLNFDILTTSVPQAVLALLTFVSLVLPIVFSLPTLLRASRLRVLEALGDQGLGTARSLRLATALEGVSSLGLRLALRNASRSSRRLAVTVLSMALGVAIFSTGFNVRQSLWVLLQGTKDELRYDVQVVLGEQVSRETAVRLFGALPNVERIELWNGGRGELQSRVVATDSGVGIVALPRDTPLFAPKVVAGRWLRASDEVEVVLNQQAWALYGHPRPGDSLELLIGGKAQRLVVAGVVEQFEKPKLYVDLDQYDARFNPKREVNSVLLVTRERGFDQVMELKRQLEQVIASSELEVLYVMSQAERVQLIYEHLNIVLTTLLALSLLVLLVSAVGMASATGINVMERTREIGVLRAIGATPAKIIQLFVLEGLVVVGLALVLGLLLAVPLSLAGSSFFGTLMLGEQARLPLALSPAGLGVTLVATIVFGWLASRIPANAAVRVAVHEALAYE